MMGGGSIVWEMAGERTDAPHADNAKPVFIHPRPRARGEVEDARAFDHGTVRQLGKGLFPQKGFAGRA